MNDQGKHTDFHHIYPTAPRLEISPSQEFRLNEIRKLKDFLKHEIDFRMKHYRRYSKAENTLSGMNSGLTTVSILTGVGGIGLLATIVSAPIVIILESIALGAGLIGIGLGIGSQQLRKKAEKHERICTLAISKLNSINDLISKALEDNNINDSEYNTVVKEYEKYLEMKTTLRNAIANASYLSEDVLKKDIMQKIKQFQLNVKK